jgi:hypothetical protein
MKSETTEQTLTERILLRVKSIFTHAGKITIIAAAMAFGFLSSEVYRKLVTKPKTVTVMNLTNVHTLGETSVAINERDELMVIDRKTGTYEIYQDSVGKMIFSLYAGKFYSEKTSTNITQ